MANSHSQVPQVPGWRSRHGAVGGCGGLCPLRRVAGGRTSSRMEEGGSPRGERNVPPFGCHTGARTSSRMAARERSERARERSERASAGARVPRAYARGQILYISGFLVRWLCIFLCNRVAHLLMRKFASEHIDIILEYRHRFSIYLHAYLGNHIG